jgi:hypothetical protein
MVYFGSYFDEDPQGPWAAAILRESAGASREDALERLYSKSGDVLTEIVGEGGEYYRRALVWARAQSFETISAGDGSGSGVQQWLRKAYGRKYDALPNESLAGMLRLAELRLAGTVYHTVGTLVRSPCFAGTSSTGSSPPVGRLTLQDRLTAAIKRARSYAASGNWNGHETGPDH